MKKYFKKGLAALLSVLISISTAFAVPVSVSALAETENFEKTTTPLPIGSDAINSANGFENLKIVPCEQLGGIYFINGNAVSFFNTDTGKTEFIATISNESYSFADSFSLGDKLYILEKNESDLALHSIITVYNLVTRSVEQTLSFENPAEVIGADDGGRIFLSHFDDESTMGITYLLSPSGEMLSSVSSKNKILYFAGLDSTNGNLFYVIYKSDSVLGTKNYLCTRVVCDDQIGETETEIEGIYTRTEIVEPAQLLQKKYMCIYNLNYSTYYKGATLNVFDSNEYNPDRNSSKKFIEQSINNQDRCESWGASGVLYEEQKCFVCLKDSDTIGKYTLTPNDYSMFKINYELASIDTAHSIFSLLQFRNGIATIEKDGSNNFYYEFFPVKSAAYVQIEGDNSIQTGCNEQLRIKTDDTFNLNVKWKSSNPEVASVSEQGEVYAWKEGSADITTTTPNGLTGMTTMKNFDAIGSSSRFGDNMFTLSAGLSVTIGKVGHKRIIDPKPYMSQNEWLLDYANGLSSRNRYLTKRVHEDELCMAEYRKILEIEGLLDLYKDRLTDKGHTKIKSLYPKNDYSGLNSLRARLANRGWDGNPNTMPRAMQKRNGMEDTEDIYSLDSLFNNSGVTDNAYLSAMLNGQEYIGW